MDSALTPTNLEAILGILTILGVIFSVYSYFRKPQERQALNEVEAEGKATLMEQRMQWEKESTEKRFIEMGIDFRSAMTLAQNHIHTVDTKVDKVNESLVGLALQVGKLATIIDERIPKK